MLYEVITARPGQLAKVTAAASRIVRQAGGRPGRGRGLISEIAHPRRAGVCSSSLDGAGYVTVYRGTPEGDMQWMAARGGYNYFSDFGQALALADVNVV